MSETNAAEKEPGTQVEKRLSFAPDDLRSIQSWDDAMRLLMDSGIDIADATEQIGDGFEMLEDKSALINQPLVFMAWMFTNGDYGAEYMIGRVVTGDGKRYVVTDGGTGLCAQLREYETRTGRQGGLKVNRGLRKSEYENEHGPGITYYLNV